MTDPAPERPARSAGPGDHDASGRPGLDGGWIGHRVGLPGSGPPDPGTRAERPRKSDETPLCSRPGLDGDARDRIGAGLRRLYGNLLAAPVPERFTLVRGLDRSSGRAPGKRPAGSRDARGATPEVR
jgi:hypothetical protein